MTKLILGSNSSSAEYWGDKNDEYVSKIDNRYHRHRIEVVKKLIPSKLYSQGQTIFDFGCGDGVIFPDFIDAGADISGIDIDAGMIRHAKRRLDEHGYNTDAVQCGNVHTLSNIETESLDAVTSFNVLAYLKKDEERLFYDQVKRILKPGGYLIVTHSNELFDLFTLNSYTVEFFDRNFLSSEYRGRIKGMLTNADLPENTESYNVRENPLSYKWKLLEYGLEEIDQSFSNLHSAPPILLNVDLKNKKFPDTTEFALGQRWKLIFMCSTYGSLSQKIR